jgi:hypothetical protein
LTCGLRTTAAFKARARLTAASKSSTSNHRSTPLPRGEDRRRNRRRCRGLVHLPEQDRLQWALSRQPRQPLQRAFRPLHKPDDLRRADAAHLLGGARGDGAAHQGLREGRGKGRARRLRLLRPAVRATVDDVLVHVVHLPGLRRGGTNPPARHRTQAEETLRPRAVVEFLGSIRPQALRGGFDITEVSATRLVNSKATARGAIVELLIT